MEIPNVMEVDGIADEVSLALDHTCIYTWMHHENGLALRFASAECVIYARIYDSSRNGIGVYCEAQSKIAKTFGFSPETVNQALHSLVEKGLIRIVCGFGSDGAEIEAYRCDVRASNRAIAAMIEYDERNDAMPEVGSRLTEARGPDAATTAARSVPATDRLGAHSEHGKYPEGFRDLLKAYPKPCSGKYVALAAAEYGRLLSEGYAQEAILRAVNDYLDEHRARNGGVVNQQFLKSLNNFLEYSTGARSYLPPIPTSEETDNLGKVKGVSFVLGTCGARRSWIARAADGSVIELDCPEASTREQLSAAYERQVEDRHAKKL